MTSSAYKSGDFDATKPDGTPGKLVDVTRPSELGWRLQIVMRQGMGTIYAGSRQHAAIAFFRRFV